MKILRVALIILALLFVITGCSSIENEVRNGNTADIIHDNENNSKHEDSEISPTPTEDIGFAYRDKYMEFIAVITGQAWECEPDIEEKQVNFYNKNAPSSKSNVIAIASTDKEDQIDRQIQFIWEQIVERFSITEFETSNITLGTEFSGIEHQFDFDDGTVGKAVGAEFNGLEHQFELDDGTIGRAVFWEGTENLYYLLLLCDKEYSNIFFEAYQSIIDTFMEYNVEAA